jgi:bis(5'-nucleosyl)-tetraphosphatase (symmetrical)
MAVYAVGDVQGYYEALVSVLDRAAFEPDRDELWLVGDLVNRGPQSLEVLRFVRSLGARAKVVLGNHEIHLLAVAEGARAAKKNDTITPILEAPDSAELIGWLRSWPLLHVDSRLGYSMVHAGVPPHWDLTEASERAREAEAFLARAGYAEVAAISDVEALELAPGASPAERARVIVSYFTRMRICTSSGRLELRFKEGPEKTPPGYQPWFAHPERRTRDVKILFGHWAALQGRADSANVYALDTGCSWGGSLTLMRLGDERRFECSCLNLRRANGSGSSPAPA